MNPAVLILSSLGGIVSFVGGIILIVRAIMKLVNATRDNTNAMETMQKSLTNLGNTVEQNTIDIAVLKDRIKR